MAGKQRDVLQTMEGSLPAKGSTDLVPLARCKKYLAKLATRSNPTGGLLSGTRNAASIQLKVEIPDATGAAAFIESCQYLLIMQMLPEISRPGKSLMFKRDLSKNEMDSMRLNMKMRSRMPSTPNGVRKSWPTAGIVGFLITHEHNSTSYEMLP